MKLLLSVFCASVLLRVSGAQRLEINAEDCVSYEGGPAATDDDGAFGASLGKEFGRRVSLGVSPLTDVMAGELQVASLSGGHACSVRFVAEVVVASCTDLRSHATRNSGTRRWPRVFAQQDTTELWLQVGEQEEESPLLSAPAATTDLLLVGRRGRHRGHLVFPSSGLRPPLRARWKALQSMNYYFNCATGCLYTKVATTQSGEHSIFLRHGESNLDLTLTYASKTRGYHVLNVTSDDLGPRRISKNLTLVWNHRTGTTGLLVDGIPVGNLTRYSALNEAGKVMAVVVEGEGFVSRCDLRFQGLTSDTCPDTPTAAATDTADGEGGEAAAKGVLISMALIFLATTVLFAALHRRASRRLQESSSARGCKDQASSPSSPSSPPPAKAGEDAGSASDVTVALSDTVATQVPPLPPPPGGEEKTTPKVVSTKDFVDVDIL